MRLFSVTIILIALFLSGCQKSSKECYNDGLKNIDKKEYKVALAAFSKAIELDSTNIDAYLERGRYGAYSGIYNQEMDLLKYTKTVSPRLANAFIGLGMMKSTNKDYSSALEYFDKAVKLEPTNIQACGSKIQMLIQLNDKSSAKRFIESLSENMKSEIKKANYSVGL